MPLEKNYTWTDYGGWSVNDLAQPAIIAQQLIVKASNETVDTFL